MELQSNSELLCEYQKLNSGPLEEQFVLLTAGSSFQPFRIYPFSKGCLFYFRHKTVEAVYYENSPLLNVLYVEEKRDSFVSWFPRR